MDNFHFDVTSEGLDHLLAIMKIAFRNNHKATHYAIDEKRGIVFLDHRRFGASSRDPVTVPETVPFGTTQATKLPFTLDAEGAADFALRWLAEASYGKEPDHDGDNGRGYKIYCEDWGQIGSDYHAFVAVKPAWAMYGK